MPATRGGHGIGKGGLYPYSTGLDVEVQGPRPLSYGLRGRHLECTAASSSSAGSVTVSEIHSRLGRRAGVLHSPGAESVCRAGCDPAAHRPCAVVAPAGRFPGQVGSWMLCLLQSNAEHRPVMLGWRVHPRLCICICICSYLSVGVCTFYSGSLIHGLVGPGAGPQRRVGHWLCEARAGGRAEERVYTEGPGGSPVRAPEDGELTMFRGSPTGAMSSCLSRRPWKTFISAQRNPTVFIQKSQFPVFTKVISFLPGCLSLDLPSWSSCAGE